MTGKVSHHEAQCAAKWSKVAERRPRPRTAARAAQCAGCEVAGGRPRAQEELPAAGDCCIMRFRIRGCEVGGQDAQQVVSARCGAGLEQKLGCLICLQVIEAGKVLEEPVVVLAFLREVPHEKGVVPEGGTEHGKLLAFQRRRDWSPTQTGAASSPLRSAMPAGSSPAEFQIRVFALESDPRMVPQGGCKGVVQRADALGRRNYVDVIKEREDGLGRRGAGSEGRRAQDAVPRNGTQASTDRPAAALGLRNVVRAAIIIVLA